jgi:hypothetical protein
MFALTEEEITQTLINDKDMARTNWLLYHEKLAHYFKKEHVNASAFVEKSYRFILDEETEEIMLRKHLFIIFSTKKDYEKFRSIKDLFIVDRMSNYAKISNNLARYWDNNLTENWFVNLDLFLDKNRWQFHDQLLMPKKLPIMVLGKKETDLTNFNSLSLS